MRKYFSALKKTDRRNFRCKPNQAKRKRIKYETPIVRKINTNFYKKWR